MSSNELMSPPHLKDILKTLEYFGIYQRFECIKCHQNLSTINLALAHLRGEYLECKVGNIRKSMLSSEEKEVFAPRKPKKFSPRSVKKEVAPSSNKRHSKYSLKQIEMILNKKKKDNVFAKQFGITTRDVAKLRYNWNKSDNYKNLLVTEVEHISDEPIKKVIMNPGKYKKPYKQQKVPEGSQEYKIESADDK